MRRALALALAVAALAGCGVSARPKLRVGAIYPTGGGQGPGGIEESRGVQLAAERSGNVTLVPVRADSVDAAVPAVHRLKQEGIDLVVGSYGSTIAKPASAEANRLGMLFWETGAVGMLDRKPGDLVFRFPPTGQVLGRKAVDFVDAQYGRPLTYAVTWIDDVYGRSVGEGALTELRERNLPVVAELPYTLPADYAALAAKVAASKADVLVVSAYLEDGVGLRRELVRRHAGLKASIGTSSSYCMRAFGTLLGTDAVGLFASDKPSGDVMDPSKLTPDAARALTWARVEYKRRWSDNMTAPALTGFAAGWALLHHVLRKARSPKPADVAAAARSIDLPEGSLPNGSGLHFDAAGDNVAASSVIWEWVRPNTRAVVWPPAMATEPVQLLAITSP